MRQGYVRHFGECSGHFNSNRSRTHEGKGQLAANFLAPGLFDRSHFFRSLERAQYLSADEVGVIERFEPRCEGPPFIVPKIVVLNASRKDKEVVRQLSSRQIDDALV